LWAAPFDRELERFAVAVQSLLVPILEAVDRFGLKVRHLRKFEKEGERFYDKNITGREDTSEAALKYQKRVSRTRKASSRSQRRTTSRGRTTWPRGPSVSWPCSGRSRDRSSSGSPRSTCYCWPFHRRAASRASRS